MAYPAISTFFIIGLSSLVSITILIFVHAFFLWLVTSKLLNFEKEDFFTSLKVASIVSIACLILSIIPVVGILVMTILYVYLIKYFFQVNFKQAFLAWLVTVALVTGIIFAVAVIYLTGFLSVLENLTPV